MPKDLPGAGAQEPDKQGRLSLAGFAEWFYNQPILLLGITSLSWAGNTVAGQLAKGEISPLALTFLRWVIVCGLLLPLYGRRIIAVREVVRQRHLYILALGMLGLTGFNSIFYVSAYYTSAVNMGILQGSLPVLVFIGAFLAYRTPVTWLQGSGVAITLVGVTLVATAGDPLSVFALGINFGDFLMLVACLLYSGYTVALKRRPVMDSLTFFFLLAVSAAVSSLPLFLFEAVTGALVWPGFKGWLVVLYVALLPSCVAQIFFLRGVDLIGPGRTGVFMNLVPVFAAVLGVALLGEPFRTYHALALLLVFGGIWLTQTRRFGGGGD